MAKPRSIEYDLKYLQSGLEVLDRYLLSGEVFWPLGISPPAGEPDYPQLTLDGLLLAKARLEAHPLTPDQHNQVDKEFSELELKRSGHRVAWENKAGQCFRMRLRMWAEFLEEYRENPAENADRYTYEVRLRVMLSLLVPDIGSHNPEEKRILNSVDTYLKSVLIEANFIWDEVIPSRFPRSEYWYLYGLLPPLTKKP